MVLLYYFHNPVGNNRAGNAPGRAVA